MEDDVTPRRAVIVGGGCAGLFAARTLRRAPVAVTLIDRRAHHLSQPLRHQCPADVKGRVVHAQGPEDGSVVVPYDDLIGAAGMRQSYFGHDESAAHAPGDLGVGLHRGTRVVDLDGQGLTVRDRDGTTTRRPARTVLWTAGGEAPPIAAALARATGALLSRFVVFASGARRERAFTMSGALPAERRRVAAAPREP